MRYFIKKWIKEQIPILQKSLPLLKQLTDPQTLTEFLSQMQNMTIQMGGTIEKADGTEEIITCLEQFCEHLYLIYRAVEEGEGIQKLLYDASQELRKILILADQCQTEYKIVFLPYKASMWDSMESVYLAAKDRDDVICQIVPIPYFNKDENNTKIEKVYEGDYLKREYDILDYREYHIEEEQPDIIFIHNPYDNWNKVTEIDTAYFSANLKKTGAVLVYLPYFLSGYCKKLENMAGCRTPGSINADYIIVQNENQKKAFQFWEIEEKKLLPLGSPKIDYVQKLMKQEKGCLENWNERLQERVVFLLNSGIHTFLNNKNWIDQIEKIIRLVISRPECGLIWRPHPLLRNTIISMKPEALKRFDDLHSLIEHSENAVLDFEEEYKHAFLYSDAMISDYSSLVLLYTYTGKPTYLLKGTAGNRQKIVFCDYFSNYFKEDGLCIEDYIENVCHETDPQKDERMHYAQTSVANANGTCGKKILEQIIQRMEKQ